MKRTATIILIRNLPKPTDLLYEHLNKYDKEWTDVYVLEAGSEPENLSQYCTWDIREPDIIEHGLRYGRGMNLGLLKLFNSGKWKSYDAFFLLTNDTELNKCATIKPLLDILEAHPRVGILSPCSKKWGERHLIGKGSTKYFWFIHNHAFFLRRQMIESIMEEDAPKPLNFLFDGSNFRGYLMESELIAKGYANDWASAITTNVFAEENESYLLKKSELIRTESFEENLKLYVEEGKSWIKRKYGFNSHWTMQQYVKSFYDAFFQHHPSLEKYRI